MSAIVEMVRKVSESVEKIRNDATQEFPVAANVGDAVRQGDIYIQLIDPIDRVPVFYKKVLTPTFPYQLAPGNTKGSRHCLERSEGIEIYTPETTEIMESQETGFLNNDLRRTLIDKIFAYSQMAEKENPALGSRHAISSEITDVLDLSGPIFVLKTKTTVSHPEHGDWVLPPGTYRCVFQRTISTSDNSIRRVLD